MNTRRAAHAAGRSWRKWEDPVIHVTQMSIKYAFLFWLLCFEIGVFLALVALALVGRL